MNINLHELFPEPPSDKEVNNMAIFLMDLALEFEKQHYSQIKRYYKELEEAMRENQAAYYPDNEDPF
jgi:hypothetical protein